MSAPASEKRVVVLPHDQWVRTAALLDTASRIFRAWQRSGVVHGEAIARWLREAEGDEVRS